MILSVSGNRRDLSGNYTPLPASFWPVDKLGRGTNALKKREEELNILKYSNLVELFEI